MIDDAFLLSIFFLLSRFYLTFLQSNQIVLTAGDGSCQWHDVVHCYQRWLITGVNRSA